MSRAVTADALTASRIAIGLAIVVVVGADELAWGGALLALAWVTDFFDGRLARSTDEPTRLGAWDLRVDSFVGVCMLFGLGIAGRAPWLVVLPVVAILAGLTVGTGNPSPVMLMLGVAYAWILWLLVSERPLGWWLPFSWIPLSAVFDWRRFTTVVLPAFFHGAAALFRRTDRSKDPVLDEWV